MSTVPQMVKKTKDMLVFFFFFFIIDYTVTEILREISTTEMKCSSIETVAPWSGIK